MNRKYLFYDKIFKKLYYNEGINNIMNTGWHDSNFIIYKGAHSNIEFIIADYDRKPIFLKGRSVIIRFIDFQTRRKLLEKEMIIVDPYKGRVKITLAPSDVDEWDEGIIEYYVLLVENDSNESFYLYNDFSQGAKGYITLKGTSISTPPVPQKLIGFKPENIDNKTFFVSNIFKGPLNLGKVDPLTTISLKLENFSGKIYLQGTLDLMTPNYQTNWSIIHLKPGFDYVEFVNETNTVAYNIFGNYSYFRILYTPENNNEGKITKIYLL